MRILEIAEIPEDTREAIINKVNQDPDGPEAKQFQRLEENVESRLAHKLQESIR